MAEAAGVLYPYPDLWNAVYEKQRMQWRREGQLEDDAPPVPLILGGWHESSDEDKELRWHQGIEWSIRHRTFGMVVNEIEKKAIDPRQNDCGSLMETAFNCWRQRNG